MPSRRLTSEQILEAEAEAPQALAVQLHDQQRGFAGHRVPVADLRDARLREPEFKPNLALGASKGLDQRGQRVHR